MVILPGISGNLSFYDIYQWVAFAHKYSKGVIIYTSNIRQKYYLKLPKNILTMVNADHFVLSSFLFVVDCIFYNKSRPVTVILVVFSFPVYGGLTAYLSWFLILAHFFFLFCVVLSQGAPLVMLASCVALLFIYMLLYVSFLHRHHVFLYAICRQ